ncbi:MAG: TIGR02172 family protein [Paludibacteraceae bacterium]|nr:TIGR02172 family protein [Paludibacteraceae bacterium]
MNNYKTIDINEWTQVGEGGTAQAYVDNSGGRLAKLYNVSFEADRAKEEFFTARTVFELGIPTPEPYCLITDGVRTGAEYELIKNKRSFSRIIADEPHRLQEISLTFADMAKALHATKADIARLHSYKQNVVRFYQEKNMVPEDYKQKALRFLETVPDLPFCLHGDLHIGNIITDGKRNLWIDVGEFAYGAPEWDLCLMWNITHSMDAKRTEHLFHLINETMLNHWNIFFPAYLGTTDPERISEATQRILCFSATKVPYIYNLIYGKPLADESFQRLIRMFGDKY